VGTQAKTTTTRTFLNNHVSIAILYNRDDAISTGAARIVGFEVYPRRCAAAPLSVPACGHGRLQLTTAACVCLSVGLIRTLSLSLFVCALCGQHIEC
jgi:hypothetical protein